MRLLVVAAALLCCCCCCQRSWAEDACDQSALLGDQEYLLLNITLQFSSTSTWKTFSLSAASQGRDLDALTMSLLGDICLAGWVSDGSCQALVANFSTLPVATGLLSMKRNDACLSIELMASDPNFLLRLQARYSIALAGMGILPLGTVSGVGLLPGTFTIEDKSTLSGPLPSVVTGMDETGPPGLGYQVALWALVAIVCACLVVVVGLCMCGKLRINRKPTEQQPWFEASNRSGETSQASELDPASYPDILQCVTDKDMDMDMDLDHVGQQFCLAGDNLVKLDSDLPDAPSLCAMSKQHGSMARSVHSSVESRDVGSLPTVMEHHNDSMQASESSHPHGSIMSRATHNFMPHGFLGNYLRRARTNPGPGEQPHGAAISLGQAELAIKSRAPESQKEKQITKIMKLISKLKVDFDTLKFQQEIGRGSSKTVFLGRWGSTAVAIVRMKKGGMVTEASIMQKLGTHPNLVQFYRWARDHQGNEYMIMELVHNGSLDKLLGNKEHTLQLHDKLKICEQICDAMCELSREGLFHCDLATRNVLVASTDPIHVKVTDFGMSREWEIPSDGDGDEATRKKRMLDCIPLRWTSPEIFRGGKWSEKSDVWAFGVTMWEIFSGGEEPFVRDLGDVTNAEIIKYVLDGNHLSQPMGCSIEVYQVMKDCWCSDADIRPTFEQLQCRFTTIRENLMKCNAFPPQHLNSAIFAPAGSGRPLRANNIHGRSSSSSSRSIEAKLMPHGLQQQADCGDHPFSAAPHGAIMMAMMSSPNNAHGIGPLDRSAFSSPEACGQQELLSPVRRSVGNGGAGVSVLSAPASSGAAQYESIAALMACSAGTTPSGSSQSAMQQPQAVNPYVPIRTIVDYDNSSCGGSCSSREDKPKSPATPDAPSPPPGNTHGHH